MWQLEWGVNPLGDHLVAEQEKELSVKKEGHNPPSSTWAFLCNRLE